MTSTLQKRLIANYEEGINECRNGLAKVCRILLKGVPVADKFVGLSNTEKKNLGFNVSQIAQIESGLDLNRMDVTMLHAIIRAFGGIVPGTILHDSLKEFKDIRNVFCHEKQNLSLNKAGLRVKLAKLRFVFTEIFEELKKYCDPSLSPSLDHDIVDLETRLTSLANTIDDELPEITETVKQGMVKLSQQVNILINETMVGAQALKYDINQAAADTLNLKQDVIIASEGAKVLKLDINQALTGAQGLKQDINQASADSINLKEDIIIASARAEDLKKDINEASAAGKDMKQDINQASEGVKDLKQDINEASSAGKDMKQDINQASEGVQDLKQDINEASAAGKDMKQDINQALEGVQDLKQDINEASAASKDMKQDINQASERVKDLKQDIHEASAAGKDMKQDINQASEGVKYLKEEINQASTRAKHKVHPKEAQAQPKKHEISTLLKLAIEKDNTQTTFKTLNKICNWIQGDKINYKKHIEENKFYTKFVALLKKNTTKGNSRNALDILNKLLNHGITNNHSFIELMEGEILRNLRKVTIQMALYIVTFQINYQETKLQKEVLRETVSTIERRWVEIKDPEVINIIFLHHIQFSTDFIGRIEYQTIELAINLSAEDLCRIFCNIGKSQRRPIPVLRSLAHHIDKHSDTLTPRKLANLLFAMNKLNFVDTVLLNRIAKNLISQVQVIEKSSIVGNVFTYIGQLRWRHTSLIENLSEWVLKNLDCCHIIDLAAFVRTIASISYYPNFLKILLISIIPKLKKEEVTETDWIDIVWSLVTLGIASAEQIASTLSQTSNKELNACTTINCPKKGMKLKLLNINAYAQHIIENSYCGPYLNLADQDDVTVPQSQSKSKLSKYIQQIFYSILPSRTYIVENIQTSMGIFVDVELSVDKDGTPIPVCDFTTHFGECESVKPLPDGAFRVAVFVWDYKDYNIDSQELIGFNKLALKLVRSVGYKVVDIPYREFDIKKDPSNYVEYLNNKIKILTFEN